MSQLWKPKGLLPLPSPGQVYTAVGQILSAGEDAVADFVGTTVNNAVEAVTNLAGGVANLPEQAANGAQTGVSVSVFKQAFSQLARTVSGLRDEVGAINSRISRLAQHIDGAGPQSSGGGGFGDISSNPLMLILLMGGTTSTLFSDPLMLILLLGGQGGAGGGFGGLSTIELMMVLGKI